MIVPIPEICSISIVNESGTTASYALFCEAPSVSPEPLSSKVTIKTIASLRGVPNGTGEATLNFNPTNLVAVCGINDEDDQQDGMGLGMSILDKRPVLACSQAEDGSRSAGSMLSMVLDGGTPRFADQPNDLPVDSVSELDSFYVQSPVGFTTRQAKDDGYVIGFGSRTSGRLARRMAPFYASFTPAPSTVYRIQPSCNYYIVPSTAPSGSTVTPSMERMACKIDFKALGSNYVHLRHTEYGKLVVCTNRDQ